MLTGCGSSERYQRSIIDKFDTVITLTADASQQKFDEMFEFSSDLIDDYHRLFDAHNEYDGIVNIATINRTAHQAPVEVCDELADLLSYSIEMHDLTDGKLNIAFGAVLELWRAAESTAFETPQEAAPPTVEELAVAAEHCDIDDLIVNTEENTVFFADPKMKLDVGGIAKGYAAQLLTEELVLAGYDNILLSMGGNITAIGGEQVSSWIVGVENPTNSSVEPMVKLELFGGKSLVVSGNYIRYFTAVDEQGNEKSYGHIIDTQTLMPPEYYDSVAVLTDRADLADALSTAIYTMPPKEALELAQKLDSVEIMLVEKNSQITVSSGFENFVQD